MHYVSDPSYIGSENKLQSSITGDITSRENVLVFVLSVFPEFIQQTLFQSDSLDAKQRLIFNRELYCCNEHKTSLA